MRTKVKKSVGTSGVADVRVLKDGLRVIFKDGDIYQVEKGNWGDRPSGVYSVTLSQTNDKILWVSPPPGITTLVAFGGFGHRQNDIPEAWIKRGGPRKSPNGGTYYAQDELSFTVMLVVKDKGPYNGLEIPYVLPYGFENEPGTQMTLINAKQKALQRLEELFRAVGFNIQQEDIPFSVNVLPWLEKKFLSLGKIFSVTLNDKGYVERVTEIPDYLLPPEIIKKSAPKKTAAKSKK